MLTNSLKVFLGNLFGIDYSPLLCVAFRISPHIIAQHTNLINFSHMIYSAKSKSTLYGWNGKNFIQTLDSSFASHSINIGD
jgi:hypothetical protein